MIDIEREVERCKQQGMPNFMIEEHILDLVAEDEDYDDLVSCNECQNTENEGGEGFIYCDENASPHYGDCMQDATVNCLYFTQKK